MRSYLIFGGAGFIGNHLRDYLSHHDPEAAIHVADMRVTQNGLLHHYCDVRQPITIHAALDERTVIFNLAAVHTTPGHPDIEYFEANIRGAENVCDFARRIRARTLVFTSSIAPYGASEERKSEESLPTPITPYGISKLVAEKIHLIWQAEDPRRRLTILRPGVVFGRGEGGNFTRLYRALSAGRFAYPGRRDTLKAAIYVKDLVRVMVAMTERPKADVQLYNCCFKAPPRLDEIVDAMRDTCGIGGWTPVVPGVALKWAASVLRLLGAGRAGFHPDRVTKLLVSTNIDGSKLDRDFPLEFDLRRALADWWRECEGRTLY